MKDMGKLFDRVERLESLVEKLTEELAKLKKDKKEDV